MSACPDVGTLMAGAAGGDLGAHVASCSACRAVVALAGEHESTSLCGEVDAMIAGCMLGDEEGEAIDETLRAHLLVCGACMALVRDSEEPGLADALFDMGALAVDDFAELRTVALDNYTRGTEIGRGGMGRIVRARDRRLGRAVAIKELLDDKLRARFEREARLTARLQHPAIVNVHEAGRWPSGAPFYVMKYVAGEPLDRLIAMTRTLPRRLAYLANVTTVVEAIAYAHSERVIHRDLKPGNILVGPFGETVVIDWGLAKDLAQTASEPGSEPPYRDATPLTIGGIGTPAYMPPEQAAGQMDDPRLDVYALGATLYHLVSGHPPFGEGPSADAVLDRLRREGPPPVSAIEPTTPPELAAIIGKAMARDPGERYATAGELADELRRYQTGQLIGAHRYSLAELWTRWLRRHRAPVALATIFVVALAAVGGVAVSRVVAARKVSERQLGELLVERGEHELVGGYPSRALVYFVAAMKRGIDTPALRFSAALASRPAKALASSIQLDARPVAVAIKLDGAEMAVAPSAGPVAIRDVRTGQPRLVLGPQSEGTMCIAYSGDGNVLVTATGCGWHEGTPAAYLWDARTGALTATLALRDDLEWAGFSDDGNRVLTAGRRIASAWTPDGKLLGSVETNLGHRYPAIFSPDGRQVAAFSGDYRIRVFELETGRLVATLAPTHARSTMRSRPGDLHSIVFDARGEQLFVGAWEDETDIFDVASGRITRTLETGTDGIEVWGEEEIAARFSADGERLVTWGTHNDARIWYPKRESPLHSQHTLPLTAGVVNATFVGDNLIVTTERDGVVRMWGPYGQERETLDLHAGPLLAVKVSDDTRSAVTVGDDGNVKAWKLEPPYLPLTDEGADGFFDGHGRILTVGSKLVSLWDTATGAELSKTTAPKEMCQTVAFTKAGTAAALDCFGAFETWDFAGAIVTRSDLAHGKGRTSEKGMSPDGERRLVWGNDADIVDPDGKVIATLHANDFALSPRGTLVAGYEDATQTVTVWDFRTGEKLRRLATPRPKAEPNSPPKLGAPGHIMVSDNDDRLVISAQGSDGLRQASVWDMTGRHIADINSTDVTPNTVLSPRGDLLLAHPDSFSIQTNSTVWSTDTGRRVCVLDSSAEAITQGAFTPDDALLITGTRSGRIMVWDASTCALLASLGAPAPSVGDVTISPDGRQLYAATSKGSGLWDLHQEPTDLAAEAALVARVPLQLDGVRLEPRQLDDPRAGSIAGRDSHPATLAEVGPSDVIKRGRLLEAATSELAMYNDVPETTLLLEAGISYGSAGSKDEAIAALTRYLSSNPDNVPASDLAEARAPIEQVIAWLRDPAHAGLDGITAHAQVGDLLAAGKIDEAESACALDIVVFNDWSEMIPRRQRRDAPLFQEIDAFSAAHEPARAARLLRIIVEVTPLGDPAAREAESRLGKLAPAPTSAPKPEPQSVPAPYHR